MPCMCMATPHVKCLHEYTMKVAAQALDSAAVHFDETANVLLNSPKEITEKLTPEALKVVHFLIGRMAKELRDMAQATLVRAGWSKEVKNGIEKDPTH